ncbi:MAG: hypothetical protein AB1488_10355 [Nitrospirota bacterium]
MRKVLNGFVGCILSLLIGISMIQAGEKETRLEEIVVTATRTEKEMEMAPGSVAVITKDTMLISSLRCRFLAEIFLPLVALSGMAGQIQRITT